MLVLFYSGITHSQDFTNVFREAVSFPVIDPKNGSQVLEAFEDALESQRPVMLTERKSLY